MHFSSVQLLSRVRSCNPMDCSTAGLPVRHQLHEFTQTHVHWVGDAIHPSHPLSSPFPPPSIFPSIRVFSKESTLHIRWPKYWSFSFSPSNEYLGLISFKTDWFDLLAVQGTLKSILQHHNLKAWIFRSAFFMVQLSHPYETTGKTIALTVWTFISKEMSLLFNMLSRFVTAFLLRSTCFLISWLQLSTAMILKPKKIKCIKSQSISVGRYRFKVVQFSSVAQSCPTLCDLMDHRRPGFPVHQTPRVYSVSCPLSRWCHPTISSSVFPFSSYLQSSPADSKR